MHLASAEFFLALIRPPTPPPVMTATEVDPSPLPPPSSSTPPSPSIEQPRLRRRVTDACRWLFCRSPPFRQETDARCFCLLAHSPQSAPLDHHRPESPGSASPTKLISSAPSQYLPLPRPPPSPPPPISAAGIASARNASSLALLISSALPEQCRPASI
ncbi:hypothetical protein DAI22_01g260600 [Oryza sativa Japonica Group]|nr:hypothetical protein DAI22_01g260600 [Oryza sativa Japonica Group]KAF2951420.1 hypothetical protein DAI22_01g260600 [Oryza sativa Japonica Group]KAF2951421.1 hypothetical protein DAI22_01g260600 [Oryza sativa Japonica Group]